MEGIPFLLQPLVDIPTLVKVILAYSRRPFAVSRALNRHASFKKKESSSDTASQSPAQYRYATVILERRAFMQSCCLQGNPSAQLQRVASLLNSAAQFCARPEVAALASHAQQGLMFKSVGRGFISGQSHAGADPSHASSSAAEVRECWHLSAEDHSLLVVEGLLPLASLHAAAVLGAPSISQQREGQRGELGKSDDSQSMSSGPAHPAKWSAPQLSQLVNRLDTHAASSLPAQTGNTPHGRGARPRTQSRLALRSMAQPDDHSGEGSATQANDHRLGYIATAAPAHALLSCITAQAKTFLTSDPMPFANAEAPLQDASAQSAAHQRAHEAPHAEASSRLKKGDAGDQRSAGAALKQGGGVLMDKAKSMARQLQLPGRHRSELQRGRVMRAEVASVRDIQVHIAGLIDVSC